MTRSFAALLLLLSCGLVAPSFATGAGRAPAAEEGEALFEEELQGEELLEEELLEVAPPAGAARATAAAATYQPFLDFRIYDGLAVSATSYTDQRNVWDITASTSVGTSSESHTGTFYAWLPGQPVAVKTFKISKPVTTADSCTSWTYEFYVTGGTKNTCSVKVCFAGKVLDFSGCSTGYVMRASVY